VRCYLMRHGHIAGVEIMPEGISDADAVERAKQLFEEQGQQGRYDGFEIWHEARFVHRWPTDS
jgi:hypothetical protein